MKPTNIFLSTATIFFISHTIHSMDPVPEVAAHLSNLVNVVESQQLSEIMRNLRVEPPISGILVDQFTGPMIVEYPPIRAKRDQTITLCKLCPKGEWILTISSIGLLTCQEIQSGKKILSHCVGDTCSDAVIDNDHENILVASNSNGHKVFHIDTKNGAKTNITHKFVSAKAPRPFKFYPMDNPNHVVVANDPSSCYDMKEKRPYLQLSRQNLYSHMSSLVTWESNRIEFRRGRRLKTWSTDATSPQITAKLPEGVRNIKKIIHTPSGIIGVTEHGAIFDLTQESICIFANIEGHFSDIDAKKNTMVVSYPNGDISLFKLYRVMDLLKVYEEQSNSDTDDESDED